VSRGTSGASGETRSPSRRAVSGDKSNSLVIQCDIHTPLEEYISVHQLLESVSGVEIMIQQQQQQQNALRSNDNRTFIIETQGMTLILSDWLLLDVVLSLSLALVFGTIFLPMSLQHLLCPLSENV